jgi:chromosome segregation ATPase
MDLIILTGAVGLVSSVITYLLTKKKMDADIHLKEANAINFELGATEKAVAIWRVLAQDLKKEVDELRELIAELRQENDKLREEIENLRNEICKQKN